MAVGGIYVVITIVNDTIIIIIVVTTASDLNNISNIKNEQDYERMRNKYRHLVPFVVNSECHTLNYKTFPHTNFPVHSSLKALRLV
jgi:hypothetical protein